MKRLSLHEKQMLPRHRCSMLAEKTDWRIRSTGPRDSISVVASSPDRHLSHRWPPRRAVNVVAILHLEQSRFQPAIVCKTRVLVITSATVRFIGVAILWVPIANAPAGFVQRS